MGVYLENFITLTITIVIINTLTIYIIRTVDTLREKYRILLVAYCSVDILNGLYVTYIQVRIWVLGYWVWVWFQPVNGSTYRYTVLML